MTGTDASFAERIETLRARRSEIEVSLGQPGAWAPTDPVTHFLSGQVLAELGLSGSEGADQKVDLLSSPTFGRFGARRHCVTVGVATVPPEPDSRG